MKKALLTLAMDGQYREMQRLTLPGKVRYAQQHGYEMVGMPPDYRHTAPLGWWKIDLMTRLLDDFDCIFYIDADMAIVDGRSDLVDEIPAAAWLGMTVHDVGPMGNVPWVGLIPNAGMMVVYRPLLPFLKAVMELAPAYGEHPWQEQGVLMLLMGFRLDFPCVRVTNTELVAAHARAECAVELASVRQMLWRAVYPPCDGRGHGTANGDVENLVWD